MARSGKTPFLIRTGFVRQLALALFGSLVVVLLIVQFVARPWVVAGSSMLPTLADGDRVVVVRLSYRVRPPAVGEIALVRGPGDEPIVKRVARAASPADRRGPRRPFEDEAPFEEGWIVLGDNAAASTDSRVFGPVPRSRFLGRVVFRYWPPSGFGPIR